MAAVPPLTHAPIGRPALTLVSAVPVALDAARPTGAQLVFVRSTVRAYCNRRGYSASVKSGAVSLASARLDAGSTLAQAVADGQRHANQLHADEQAESARRGWFR